MTWGQYQLVSVVNLACCLGIVWACICRLNDHTCRHHLRPRARYSLLLAGALASGAQPLLFHTMPGPGETILAASVLAGLLINVGRWTNRGGHCRRKDDL